MLFIGVVDKVYDWLLKMLQVCMTVIIYFSLALNAQHDLYILMKNDIAFFNHSRFYLIFTILFFYSLWKNIVQAKNGTGWRKSLFGSSLFLLV